MKKRPLKRSIEYKTMRHTLLNWQNDTAFFLKSTRPSASTVTLPGTRFPYDPGKRAAKAEHTSKDFYLTWMNRIKGITAKPGVVLIYILSTAIN